MDVLLRSAWLLKSVCVAVTWIACPVVTAANLALCEAPANAAELHILSSPLTTDTTPHAMGLAMPRSGSGGRAGVFLSRVRNVVDSNPGLVSLAHLLGDVMAHEIGHLLLRSSAHSSEGIMRAEYRPSDLQKASQRQLRFTDEQVSAIHWGK